MFCFVLFCFSWENVVYLWSICDMDTFVWFDILQWNVSYLLGNTRTGLENHVSDI